MKPLPRLTPENEAARRAEYERAFLFGDEDRAPSGAVVALIVGSFALVCIGFGILIGGML